MADSIDHSNAIEGITDEISTTAGGTTTTTSTGNSSAPVASASSATMTMTVAPPTEAQMNDGVLRLTLQDRPGVTWDEDVIDNEGMGKKSSKRCCIFHKSKAFGESSTDSSDYDSDNENGKYSNKKIAHKKNLPEKKKIPDQLRFHA